MTTNGTRGDGAMRTADMDTTDMICVLIREAWAARDYEQVDLCTDALAGDVDANIECERILDEKRDR